MKVFIASTIIAVALAAPASADKFTATFTGIITDGSDSINAFGQSGGDLTGQGFTAVFTLDDTAADTYIQNDPVYYGVYNSGPASPISATLTIGGVKQTFLSDASAYESYLSWTRYPGGTFDQFMGNVVDYQDDGHAITLAGIQVYGNSLSDFLSSGLDYHIPFSTDFGPGQPGAGGTVQLLSYLDSSGTMLYDEEFGLSVSHVTYAAFPSGGVPEPASWAMMLGGFGLVGSAMRRRVTVRVA